MKNDNYHPLTLFSASQRRYTPSATSAASVEQQLRNLSRNLRRRWKYLLGCGVVSLVVGYVLASRFASLSWTHESALLYSKPAAIGSYTPPDADSLAKLFKSPEMLWKMSTAAGVDTWPANRLDAALSIAPPYGSCVLKITFDGSDENEGGVVLDKCVAVFQDQIAGQRERALDQVSQGLRVSQERVREALVAARQKEGEMARTHGVADLPAMLTALRGDLTDLERDLADQRSERSAVEAQFMGIANPNNAQLTQLIDKATSLSRTKIAEMESLHAARRAEYQRLLDVHKLFHDLEEEITALTYKRQRLEDELGVIDQMLAGRMSGFSVVQAGTITLDSPKSNKRKLLLGLSLFVMLVLAAPVAGLEFIRCRESALHAWARRTGLPVLARVSDLPVPGDATGGIEVRDTFDNDLLAAPLEGAANHDAWRLLALRIQQSMERSGSAIMFCGLGARPAPDRLPWNLACCFARRGERVLLLRLEAGEHSPQAATAGRLYDFMETHLTKAGHAPASGNGAASNGSAESKTAGETSGTAVAEPRGLAAYFARTSDVLDDLIHPTSLPNVDRLRSAEFPLPHESWGTQRMTDLLNHLRERYTLVLISGPSVAQPVDLQMLAARVDGIVLSAPADGQISPSADVVVNDLLQLSAPIMGLVT